MFRLIKILSGRTGQAEPEKLPATAAEYTIGEALVLENGVLVACPANGKPTYLSCEEKEITEDGAPLSVYLISPAMVLECPVVGDASALVLGKKVALSADAKGINAAATGSATIYDLAYADKGLVSVIFD